MGLLGKIGSGVKGLLNSPVAQGIGAVAALGFNPALGLLMAPGLKNDRDRRKDEAEARRLRLSQMKSQDEASRQLTGLLNSNESASLPGMELESIDGPSQTLPGRRAPILETPQGQKQLRGLLSQANPQGFAQQMTQGLLGQQRSAPSLIREMEALGYPTTPEGLAAYQKAKGGSVQELLGQFQIERELAELQRQQEERQQSAAEKRKAANARKWSREGTVTDAMRLVELNDRLEPTLLSTGLPLEDFRKGANSVAQFFSADPDRYKQERTDLDEFNKLAGQFGFKLAESIEGFDTNTDAKLKQLQQMTAGSGVMPGANRKIIAHVLETVLFQADQEGAPIKDREKIEATIKKLKQDAPQYRTFDPATGQVN